MRIVALVCGLAALHPVVAPIHNVQEMGTAQARAAVVSGVLLAAGDAGMVQQTAREPRPPIIDMHMHALPADDNGPPPVDICSPLPAMPTWDPAMPYVKVFYEQIKACHDPIWSPKTDDEIMRQTIAIMERRNIIGVLSGTPERVDTWVKASPQRFIRGLGFRIGRDPQLTPSILQKMHAAGRLAVLAEVSNQYAGIAPDDPWMEPYWALAEQIDMPVGIHIGVGPPGAIYLGDSHYRALFYSALTLEEVLVRHPRLRVYIMHAGFPMLDDLLAVLYAHPQVHVDVAAISFTQPRPAFHRYLQAIVDAGFDKRVMFGSDQMVWPAAIERALAPIEEATFLTPARKRDILYNNAARFLRLSAEEIAWHHGKASPTARRP